MNIPISEPLPLFKLLFNKFLLILIISSFIKCKKDVSPDVDFEGYSLVWSDEFDDNQINSLNWVHELGDGTAYGLPAGWGNNEIQLYTDNIENSYIETDENNTSSLVIEVTEENPGEYLSAKLTTQGLRNFKYGKIDARIKLPTGQGMWPAFWMLGENKSIIDWPGCGEIDIVELVGHSPSTAHANVHYTNGNNEYSNDEGMPKTISQTFDQEYHNFSIDWTPSEINFSLDGEIYKTTNLSDDMKEFQRSFYLILNVAVGGPWAGNPNASTTFPQKMYVDYIRYYSKNDFTPPIEPELIIAEETVGNYVPPTLAEQAFNSSFNHFQDLELNIFGAGGEPFITASDSSIEGDSALLFSFPGGNWGGGWFESPTGSDCSSFSNGRLVFSLKIPNDFYDAEIKLESFTNSASVYLIDYTSSPVANGYVEYSIPITDFINLDLTEMKIPFALWNPKNSVGAFDPFDIYVDNIYWEP